MNKNDLIFLIEDNDGNKFGNWDEIIIKNGNGNLRILFYV